MCLVLKFGVAKFHPYKLSPSVKNIFLMKNDDFEYDFPNHIEIRFKKTRFFTYSN